MSLNLDDKKAVVAEVSAELAQAQAVVIAEYRGLEVGNVTALRAKAREQGDDIGSAQNWGNANWAASA